MDRKKELIINAGGKNMSPANIEARIKSGSSLIGQAIAVGDGKPFNVALITLDPDAAPAFATKHGIEDSSFELLAANADVVAEIQRGVDEGNAKLARVEQIKQFTIADGVGARRRRADPDDEAQAQADRREVRGGDRDPLLLSLRIGHDVRSCWGIRRSGRDPGVTCHG